MTKKVSGNYARVGEKKVLGQFSERNVSSFFFWLGGEAENYKNIVSVQFSERTREDELIFREMTKTSLHAF